MLGRITLVRMMNALGVLNVVCPLRKVTLQTAVDDDLLRTPPCRITGFNTINKWAAGVSDTLALGILCEAYGMGVPTAVLPYLNAAQAAHPAYARSLEVLREMNVMIGTYEPHRPKAGGGADRFRWEEALDLLEPRLGRRA
ncbi:hypothetical protein [Streptomyces viridosporus]|uniref:hypothetical protein n=1 Tax=Streptomyces viridosporus TaxID=67581 RepID=UPI0034CEBD88